MLAALSGFGKQKVTVARLLIIKLFIMTIIEIEILVFTWLSGVLSGAIIMFWIASRIIEKKSENN